MRRAGAPVGEAAPAQGDKRKKEERRAEQEAATTSVEAGEHVEAAKEDRPAAKKRKGDAKAAAAEVERQLASVSGIMSKQVSIVRGGPALRRL